MKTELSLIAINTLTLLLGCPLVMTLDPSLKFSQYGYAAWTAQNGFSLGELHTMRR
jgi:hypothetical protein